MPKLLQAADAFIGLARQPTHLPHIIQFIDAMADFPVFRAMHRRMFRELSGAELARLRDLTNRPLDYDALARLPANTFGHQFAAYMRRKGFTQEAFIEAFPPLAETGEQQWLVKRFARLHDLFHFLVGFETSVANEMGMLAFNVRNFQEPFSLFGLMGLPFVFAAHGQVRENLRELKRGWALGARARNLMAVPLEELLEHDLQEVRRQVGLID